MFSKNILASRLFELRKEKGIGQQTLAEYLGVSFHQVSKIETGQRGASLEVACSIADYFDVSLDYLVGRSDDPTRR